MPTHGRSQAYCVCLCVSDWLNEGGAEGGTSQEGSSGPVQEATGLHAESIRVGGRKTNGTQPSVPMGKKLKSIRCVAGSCFICFCLYRKSSPWCCCLSAWQRASKTLMQSRLSGAVIDPAIPPCSDQNTWLQSHEYLLTLGWPFSVLGERERGSPLLPLYTDTADVSYW